MHGKNRLLEAWMQAAFSAVEPMTLAAATNRAEIQVGFCDLKRRDMGLNQRRSTLSLPAISRLDTHFSELYCAAAL